MRYRLSLAQPLHETVPAIAAGQIDAAIERLKSADHDHTAIHAARRYFKRTRALLGLVEPVASGKIAKFGQKRLASAARVLGASRDAQVTTSAAEDLERDFGKGANALAFSDLTSFLKARRDRAGETLHHAGVKKVLEELEKTKASFSKLNLDSTAVSDLIEPASQTYRHGRRAMRDALETCGEEDLHRWRKLVQRHWRHMLLLKDAWPKEAKARISLARRLSGELGLHHDLAVLRETILTNRIAFRSPSDVIMLCRYVEKKQEQLARKAASRGEQLYAEKPKAFAGRLQAYWESAKQEQAQDAAQAGL
jgi:CHAD domain-containing protein